MNDITSLLNIAIPSAYALWFGSTLVRKDFSKYEHVLAVALGFAFVAIRSYLNQGGYW